MATTKKGLLKGLRYITHIFDEEKEEQEMQIGFPTDVKHVAHIGSDSPSVNTPSWMNDFKPQDQENGQAGSRGDGPKLNPEGKNQRSVGLFPPVVQTEKPKNKTRRKPRASSPTGSAGDAPPSKPSRRSSQVSMDTSDASVRRRRSQASAPDTENGDELSVKKSKGTDENSIVDSVVTSYSSEKNMIKRFF